MIRGIHGLFYSSAPEATRKFFRDQVQLPGSDIGQGWWIFDLPEGDLGVHPVDDPADAGGHDVSFYCDDIEGTVKELRARGVQFTQEIQERGYGRVTYFDAPGGISVQLYEPRYKKPQARKPAPKKAKKPAARPKAKKARAQAKAKPRAKARRR